MRPGYLDDVRLSKPWPFARKRSVYFGPVRLGRVELVSTWSGSFWRDMRGGRAYSSARHAADSLAVYRFDGATAVATFDAERVTAERRAERVA